MSEFPMHLIDTYLPKLVRAGERVAISNLPEELERTASVKKEAAPSATGYDAGQEVAEERQAEMAAEQEENEQRATIRR